MASAPATPLLVLLDDREGLVRASPGFAHLRSLLGGRVSVLDAPLASLGASELDSLKDARFALAVRERTLFNAATLDRLPALELLLQTGGHAYHVDAAELRARGVATALGRRARCVLSAVPELTMMLMLACVRRLGESVRSMSAGGGGGGGSGWPSLVGRNLAGRRLGILGLGRHGRNVARLASAFGMEVVAWDRAGGSGSAGAPPVDGIARLPLSTLLATCDVVSIHLRLSPESTRLLDRAALASMKPRSVLINTSRGAIVDEDALAEALVTGRLGAAGLDVFVDEPLSPASPLRSAPNAVLTPHVGWTTEEVREGRKLEGWRDGGRVDDPLFRLF